MTKDTDSIWAWLQAQGKIFKVVSNPNNGAIMVYDENGRVLMKKINLSKKQVEIVEDSFLYVVAKKLNNIDFKNYREQFDPMIA